MLVVIDRATRQAAGDGLGAIAAPVVIVGDDLDDDGLIAAMLDAPVSHLVTDPSDRDLGITSAKLASSGRVYKNATVRMPRRAAHAQAVSASSPSIVTSSRPEPTGTLS